MSTFGKFTTVPPRLRAQLRLLLRSVARQRRFQLVTAMIAGLLIGIAGMFAVGSVGDHPGGSDSHSIFGQQHPDGQRGGHEHD